MTTTYENFLPSEFFYKRAFYISDDDIPYFFLSFLTIKEVSMNILIANSAHSSVSGLFIFLHTVGGNGDKNKFGSELIKSLILFFSVGNGAMNALRYCELQDDAFSGVDTSANTPHFSFPYDAMNFNGHAGN